MISPPREINKNGSSNFKPGIRTIGNLVMKKGGLWNSAWQSRGVDRARTFNLSTE